MATLRPSENCNLPEGANPRNCTMQQSLRNRDLQEFKKFTNEWLQHYDLLQMAICQRVLVLEIERFNVVMNFAIYCTDALENAEKEPSVCKTL